MADDHRLIERDCRLGLIAFLVNPAQPIGGVGVEWVKTYPTGDAASPDVNDHHTLCMTFDEMHAVVGTAHNHKLKVTPNLLWQVAQAKLTVVGISPQRPERHQAFRARYSLPFTLLADPDKEVIKVYEAIGLLGFGARRITYLIDRNRYVRDRESSRFRIERHIELIRRAFSTQA